VSAFRGSVHPAGLFLYKKLILSFAVECLGAQSTPLEETMDIGKSFSFPFEDKEWLSKLGLGAIISIVPILNFAWSGYMVGIIRNVMNNSADPLPTWDDLDEKFKDGLILFGASIIYALPILIALCLPLSAMAFSGLLSGNSDMKDFGQIIGEAGGVLFFGLLCVFALYGIALSIIYPAILIIFSREGTFASCFKFREVFDLISKNAGPFFTAWALSLVGSLGVGLAIGIVNSIIGWIPCIGWIASIILSFGSGIYISAVYAHLFGQFGASTFGSNQLATVA
jgi:hypothetical protein